MKVDMGTGGGWGDGVGRNLVIVGLNVGVGFSGTKLSTGKLSNCLHLLPRSLLN